MADFQRDMNRYENLIKNDLLNFKGKFCFCAAFS